MQIDEFTLIILYRVSTILVGAWIVFMGYSLFTKGLFGKASDLKAAWGYRHLEIKQAAPGTIFALFGAAVIVFSIHKGVSFENQETATMDSSNEITDLISSAYPSEMMELIFSLAAGENLNDEQKTKILNWAYERKTKISAEHLEVPDGFPES